MKDRPALEATMRFLPVLALIPTLAAQEPVPPWRPTWELTLRGDRIASRGEPEADFSRASARLRVRTAWEAGPWSGTLGLWAALGTDPNALNRERYDQQPSTALRLDAAWIQGEWLHPAAFASFRAGLQENPLVSQESLWDRDLRVAGLSARAAWRSERVPEAGLRVVAGRVPLLLGQPADLRALQGILSMEIGAFDATLHAARWRLRWKPGPDRALALPGSPPDRRQEETLDAWGALLRWTGALPLEARGLHHRNPDTRETGAELQLWAGGRLHPWRPQVGWIWQRFSRTGTFHPLNGDDWWFMWNARGPRWEVVLPLPRKWLVSVTWLRHTTYRQYVSPVDRTLVQAMKRF